MNRERSSRGGCSLLIISRVICDNAGSFALPIHVDLVEWLELDVSAVRSRRQILADGFVHAEDLECSILLRISITAACDSLIRLKWLNPPVSLITATLWRICLLLFGKPILRAAVRSREVHSSRRVAWRRYF